MKISQLFEKYADTTDKVRSHNYGPVYDAILGQYENQDIKMLEIGIFAGGSTKSFEEFLGPKSTLVAVDPHLQNLRHKFDRAIVLGIDAFSSDSLQLLQRHGPFDVILDDSYHSFESHKFLLSVVYDTLLVPGGLMILEDVMYGEPEVQKLCRDTGAVYIDNRWRLPYTRAQAPRDYDGSFIIFKRKPIPSPAA